jgi:hypothetical protein
MAFMLSASAGLVPMVIMVVLIGSLGIVALFSIGTGLDASIVGNYIFNSLSNELDRAV